MQLFDESGRPTIDFDTPAEKPDFGLQDKVLRVGEFLDLVQEIIRPLTVTIRGEISSVSERGNAFYINLSDATEKAVLNCFMWRRNGDYLRSILREGAEVEVTGYPSIYKPFGKFSLTIERITPVGEGALQQAFEALKRQLQEEGYFAEERKRPLPDYVNSVGLITSSFGDARNDFLTHLGDHGLTLYFHDVRVEGVNAVQSIVHAIEWFNRNTTDVEVLVLTRGGGSLESLQAFNSLEVAQAIFSSRIPVISAIGHENDISIADLVADVRASTPTHAGKVLGQPWTAATERIVEIDRTLTRLFSQAADHHQQRFDFLARSMVNAYQNALTQTNVQINNVEQQSIRLYQSALQQALHRLTYAGNSLVNHFRNVFTRFHQLEQQFRETQLRLSNIFQQKKLLVSQSEQTLQATASAWWSRLEKQLSMHDRYLSLSDPHQKLKQGYSISYTAEGHVLKSIDSASSGAIITTQVADGTITSSVTKTHVSKKTI